MNKTDRHNGAVAPADDPERVADFIAHVRSGGVVEVDDWMPHDYRRSLVRFIEMHAHSEYMGALLERDWLARAPTLDRKLGLAAKVQDEIGHAQLLYRLLADLGVSVDAALARLRAGKAKFHWFFHFLAEDWAATGMIAWLSDMAAAIAQGDLAGGSYAPYRRALAKICWEEQFHISYGHDVVKALAEGTPVQREMVQNALNVWWPRLLAFNGPPTLRQDDPNITDWCIKHLTNEDMRQRFLSQSVDDIRQMGLEIDDPLLSFDENTKRWSYTEPDWEGLQRFRLGEGPATRFWLALRQRRHQGNEWIAETIANSAIEEGRHVGLQVNG